MTDYIPMRDFNTGDKVVSKGGRHGIVFDVQGDTVSVKFGKNDYGLYSALNLSHAGEHTPRKGTVVTMQQEGNDIVVKITPPLLDGKTMTIDGVEYLLTKID